MDAVRSPPGLHVVTRGRGPAVWFVHGSAADHTTWSIQLASRLTEVAELVAYDRVGTPTTPLADGDAYSVEQHARDAADLIRARGGAPVVLVGSSFGAVVVLELLRSAPELMRHAILCEPPLAAENAVPPVPVAFVAEFDRLVAEEGGEAAGEYFLRTVLTDEVFEKIPRMFRDRSVTLWAQIRADMRALLNYDIDYSALRSVKTPVTLVAGERSAAYFRPTVEALAAHLPNARIQILGGAGHLMHAEAHRQFAELIRDVI